MKPIRRLSIITVTGLWVFIMFAMIVASLDAAPVVRSCPTPAENLKTLEACEKTATAQAQATTTPTVRVVTTTPSATRTPAATPTRITLGTPVPVSVVLFGVTYPLDMERDCVRTGGKLKCLIEVWVEVDAP